MSFMLGMAGGYPCCCDLFGSGSTIVPPAGPPCTECLDDLTAQQYQIDVSSDWVAGLACTTAECNDQLSGLFILDPMVASCEWESECISFTCTVAGGPDGKKYELKFNATNIIVRYRTFPDGCNPVFGSNVGCFTKTGLSANYDCLASYTLTSPAGNCSDNWADANCDGSSVTMELSVAP